MFSALRASVLRVRYAPFPVVIGCFREAIHRSLLILLCNFARPLPQEVDDALTRFQISVPRSSLLPSGGHAQANERKKRLQDVPRTLEHIEASRSLCKRP